MPKVAPLNIGGKVLKIRKGEMELMPLVIGVIFLAILLPVIYLAIQPVYTTSSIANETFTMAASPIPVQLANKDIVGGSELVYNVTGDTAIAEGEASAADCGGGDHTCYYNFTDGNKYTYGTVTVNNTGSFAVSYAYYPAGYSHLAQDRAVIVMLTTFLILGVLVIIVKVAGLI